jgi:UDP-glucose 4-epimerase/UDP-glucuronate 4-epimerase
VNVLITGSAGFLGTHLLRAFRALVPDAVLHAADLPGAPPPAHDAVAHALDVTDAAAVEQLMARALPAIVVHAAAITPNLEMEQMAAPRIVAVNVGGTANVLHAALRLPGFRRVIALSSGAVYGSAPDLPHPVTEDQPAAPAVLYGHTKVAVEGIARRLAHIHGKSCVSVRPAALYSVEERPTPHRPRASEVHDLLAALRQRRPVATTPTAALRDWTHADDAADAIAHLALAPALSHDCYNVSSGAAMSWAETLALFQRHGLRVVAPGTDGAQAIAGPVSRPALSIARLRQDIGFAPTRTLAATIAQALAA